MKQVISEAFCQAMKDSKMTIRELSKASGVPHRTIDCARAGCASLKMYSRLFDVLGVKIIELKTSTLERKLQISEK